MSLEGPLFCGVLHYFRLLCFGRAVGLEKRLEHFFLLGVENPVGPGDGNERLDDGVLFFVHHARPLFVGRFCRQLHHVRAACFCRRFGRISGRDAKPFSNL